MADTKYLTAEEVPKRYRDEITVGTLRNWRAMRFRVLVGNRAR